jgi:hypothetical protein
MNGTSRERTSSTARAPTRSGIAEAGIEEARIVNAEFADQGIERHHLGRIIGRHLHGFFGGQDVELVGIENEAAVGARLHWLPEFPHVVAGAALHVDHAGVALGAVADEAVGAQPAKINAYGHAFADIRVIVIDKPLERVQRAQCLRIEQPVAVAEADL